MRKWLGCCRESAEGYIGERGKMMKDVASFRVPAWLKDEIEKRAKEEEISVSSCVLNLIQAGLKKSELTEEEKVELEIMRTSRWR